MNALGIGLCILALIFAVVFVIKAADASGHFMDGSFRWGVRDDEDHKDDDQENNDGEG